MKFCDKLQKIRKENNITQEGLADKLNVSRQAVSKWESGQAYPDTEKLIQISKIFHVSLDELIHDDKKSTTETNEKISFMEIINRVLEFISKSVDMFWSMKFMEKIKCLFEMAVLILVIIIVALVSTSVMVNLVRRILLFLPSGLLYAICNLFETLLSIVWIVLGAIIVIRIFKTRYLDYYVFVLDDSIDKKTIEEPIQELKEKKECKVVIRDPKDSSLNIFKKIGKVFHFFVQFLCLMMEIPFILFFIFCVLLFVFSAFYLFDGIFFNGISLAIFGVILFTYLIIEFLYNVLFNRKHAIHRLFVMFIGSITFIGIGLGLSFAAISSFSYEENEKKETTLHTIKMSDDLVINSMQYEIGYDDIVIDNTLDAVKLEITSYGNMEAYLYEYVRYNALGKAYRVIGLDADYNEMEIYNEIIENLKEGKIVDYDRPYEVKMYVSEDNLTKLRENMNKYDETIWD